MSEVKGIFRKINHNDVCGCLGNKNEDTDFSRIKQKRPMRPHRNGVVLPGPIREAVLALLGRTSRPERQPSLPPFAARLCQSKSATDLRTPSAPLAPAQRDCWCRLAPTALIRKSGHGQQSVVPLAALAPQLPAHRAGPSPLAPEGENNRPGGEVPVRPSVPRIRVH